MKMWKIKKAGYNDSLYYDLSLLYRRRQCYIDLKNLKNFEMRYLICA